MNNLSIPLISLGFLHDCVSKFLGAKKNPTGKIVVFISDYISELANNDAMNNACFTGSLAEINSIFC